MLRWTLLVSTLLLMAFSLAAQTPTATIDGRVIDTSKAVITGATVDAINLDTNVKYARQTNSNGLFSIGNLPPGNYRVEVSKPGFRTIVKPSMILHVQDLIALNFEMSVGSTLESVTVEGGAPLVNTESPAVATVVDRNFAENLPMNGRSFQTLIQLTPGVVQTVSSQADAGQFSVNGQRAASNYWMVDGVSANVGVGTTGSPGNGFAGALGAFSVQGGTNSLVSVDALQEFRIQTSTYAPEFGRVPGGQISILTRSGTNRLSGTLFDYFRNDLLDANDWFANNQHLAKPEERQNDFGGTLGGPVIKNRTFFFLSYEGLRLRLPRTALTTVPSVQARQSADPAIQPFLNAFPLPDGPDQGNGIAPLNTTFSNSSSLDAYSLRIDHKVTERLSLFGRYDYSPSELKQRGFGIDSLSTVEKARITAQTLTLGGIATISPRTVNDLRVNYSRTNATNRASLDAFDGAVPLASAPLPSPFTAENSGFLFDIFALANGGIRLGKNPHYIQRQWNTVDNLSMERGPHSIKFGVDFRRLSPVYDPQSYSQFAFFNDVASAGSGSLGIGFVEASRRADFLFRNLGVFAQDTWRIWPRLTLTYGLRWDVDVAPATSKGPNLLAVTGFNLQDLSGLGLAPAGTAPFRTPYRNMAPRIGFASQLSPNPKWGTVVRGGFGVFFDMATQESGTALDFTNYPFGAANSSLGGTFPLSPSVASPPPIVATTLATGLLHAFDPQLELPYTLQWNLAIQQALGTHQSFTASYIGAAGRRLIQTAYVFSPNPQFGSAELVTNAGTSDYDALQLQFERRLARGLQMLSSYTWSHSIDTASAGSLGSLSNALVPGINPKANRGPSDFDVRHSLSTGLTYDLPAPQIGMLGNIALHGWSLENIVRANSAPPVNVFNSMFFDLSNAFTSVRPDLVPSVPLYLQGPQYAGGKAFNPAAFVNPPTDPSTGVPLRQGTLPRNFVRGFRAVQWDLAVHRDFPLPRDMKLQFRAEMFNVLNHPNFGQPIGDLNNPQFGTSTQMLGQYLNSFNGGGGAFSALYQIGGPRSIQLTLKLRF